MVSRMTGSFYLTETVTIPSGTSASGRVQGEVDLGAYVNVPTGQAIAIDSVDFIWQAGADYGTDVEAMVNANGTLTMQLSDLNPGTAFVRADDQALIASGNVNIDQANNIATHVADLYPDNFGGKASLSEAFMVVNDTLYLVGGVDGADVSTLDLFLTARIRCSVVKLDSKAWMAIAIQSTASDN